ncbi:hypothetical protein M885DRAFT_518373 [Pelagophyceae sp. CCMP2097]|nr:hypothetical protein M885DRAFT_518373 [Pelagophyceae sp. CCMP2097]
MGGQFSLGTDVNCPMPNMVCPCGAGDGRGFVEDFLGDFQLPDNDQPCSSSFSTDADGAPPAAAVSAGVSAGGFEAAARGGSAAEPSSADEGAVNALLSAAAHVTTVYVEARRPLAPVSDNTSASARELAQQSLLDTETAFVKEFLSLISEGLNLTTSLGEQVKLEIKEKPHKAIEFTGSQHTICFKDLISITHARQLAIAEDMALRSMLIVPLDGPAILLSADNVFLQCHIFELCTQNYIRGEEYSRYDACTARAARFACQAE